MDNLSDLLLTTPVVTSNNSENISSDPLHGSPISFNNGESQDSDDTISIVFPESEENTNPFEDNVTGDNLSSYGLASPAGVNDYVENINTVFLDERSDSDESISILHNISPEPREDTSSDNSLSSSRLIIPVDTSDNIANINESLDIDESVSPLHNTASVAIEDLISDNPGFMLPELTLPINACIDLDPGIIEMSENYVPSSNRDMYSMYHTIKSVACPTAVTKKADFTVDMNIDKELTYNDMVEIYHEKLKTKLSYKYYLRDIEMDIPDDNFPICNIYNWEETIIWIFSLDKENVDICKKNSLLEYVTRHPKTSGKMLNDVIRYYKIMNKINNCSVCYCKDISGDKQGSHVLSKNEFISNNSLEIDNQMYRYTWRGVRLEPSIKKVCYCVSKTRTRHVQDRNIACMPIFHKNHQIFGNKFPKGYPVACNQLLNNISRDVDVKVIFESTCFNYKLELIEMLRTCDSFYEYFSKRQIEFGKDLNRAYLSWYRTFDADQTFTLKCPCFPTANPCITNHNKGKNILKLHNCYYFEEIEHYSRVVTEKTKLFIQDNNVLKVKELTLDIATCTTCEGKLTCKKFQTTETRKIKMIIKINGASIADRDKNILNIEHVLARNYINETMFAILKEWINGESINTYPSFMFSILDITSADVRLSMAENSLDDV